MASLYEGSCACGSVRFRCAAVIDVGYCHCDACRRASGAPVYTWARSEVGDFTSVGPLRDAAGGAHGQRKICSECGSWLASARDGWIEWSVACLDSPQSLAPRVHRHVAAMLPWLKLSDLLDHGDAENVPEGDARRMWRKPKDPRVRRESRVELRDVTRENLREVLFLDVAGAQRRFVASNAISLAQAWFAPAEARVWLRVGVAESVAVGYVQCEVVREEVQGLDLRGKPYVWRFLVDERYQGLGLGRQLLALTIEHYRGQSTELWLSAVPGAGSPIPFYESMGFTRTGVFDDGEELMVLRY